MTAARLTEFAERLRGVLSQQKIVHQIVAVGQARLGEMRWIWLETRAQGGGVFKVAGLNYDAEDAQVWSFIAPVGAQIIQVQCIVPVPKGTQTEGESVLDRARTDCAAALTRMRFTEKKQDNLVSRKP